MKTYLKSLFPFRWLIIVLFIFFTSPLIGIMFVVNPVSVATAYMWYAGNVLTWFLIDYCFGIGRSEPSLIKNIIGLVFIACLSIYLSMAFNFQY